jgi:hypothetical protein
MIASEAQDHVPYVVLSGRGLEWAVPAERVTEVVREADWTGSAPVDVAALWGEDEQSDVPMRVLVIKTALGPFGLRAARITYRSVARSEVCPLPALMARTPAAAFVVGLVFEEPHPALVVLDPEGLSHDRASVVSP